jgi:two-component system response regulator NreC
MPVNVLIVDSHIIYRNGLKLLIEKNPDFKVSGEASTLPEMVEQLDCNKPDVVLINKSFPVSELHQMFAVLNKLKDEISTICITNDASENTIRECLEQGVKAVLWKKSTVEILREAILTVASGELFVELPFTRIGSKIIEHAHNAHFGESNFGELSDREYEVLKLFARGLTYKGIGEVLHISPRTVESHKNHILSKLRLHSVTDMVKYAIKHELIEL